MQYTARLVATRLFCLNGCGSRKLSRLALWAVVAIACMGCCQVAIDREPNAIGRVVLLSELIQVQIPARSEDGCGDPDSRVRFYHRGTGREVALDTVRVSGETSAVILAARFSEGLLVARRSSGVLQGYVDCAGRVVIPFRFAAAEPFCDGRARAQLPGGDDAHDGGSGWGLIDRNGRWVVRPDRYDDLGPFREERCAFRKGELYGLLDASGREVVAPRYRLLRPFQSGLAVAETRNGETVYIDPNGRVQLRPPKNASDAGSFYQGVAWFSVLQGEEDPEDGDDLPLPESLKARRFGLFSVSGQVIAPAIYTGMGEFSEGLVAVSKQATESNDNDQEPNRLRWENEQKGLWGYMDVAGKVVIPFRFERAGRFSNGLARVYQDGKWGYIDKSGRVAIPCRFRRARDFRRGLAEVWDDESIKLIDRSGRVVLDTGLEPVTF